VAAVWQLAPCGSTASVCAYAFGITGAVCEVVLNESTSSLATKFRSRIGKSI
jgi:hypothetical protein